MADNTPITDDNPVVKARLARSDAWLPKYRRELFKTLQRQYKEASKNVLTGSANIVSASMMIRWKQELIDAKTPYIYEMITESYKSTLIELEGESKKIAEGKVDIVNQQINETNFILRGRKVDIDQWVEETSELETETTRNKISKIYENARVEGFTTNQIARQIVVQGISQNKSRSVMLARTGTIWAHNEGAQLQYIDYGVQVKEWYVAVDDRVCEFCLQMDGQRVRTEDPFIPVGAELKGIEGGIMSIPFAVYHPPVHPMCRCVLLPVMWVGGQATLVSGQIRRSAKRSWLQKKQAARDKKKANVSKKRTDKKKKAVKKKEAVEIEKLERQVQAKPPKVSKKPIIEKPEAVKPAPKPPVDKQKEWEKNLPKKDLEAIREWEDGQTAYNVRNLMLRGKEALWEYEPEEINEILKLAKRLQKISDDAPNYKGTIYRGAKLDQSDLDKIKVGMDWEEKVIASASKEKDVASYFANFHSDPLTGSFEAYEGPKAILTIKSKTGVDISNLAKINKEAEVWIRSKSKYKVTGVKHNVKGTVKGKDFRYTEIILQEK